MLIITMQDGDHRLQLYQYGKGNQSSFFQRMATLLIGWGKSIRGLKNLWKNMRTGMRSQAVLKDESGRILVSGPCYRFFRPMQDKQGRSGRSRRQCRRRQNKERLGSDTAGEASMKFKRISAQKSIGEYLHQSIPKKAVSISISYLHRQKSPLEIMKKHLPFYLGVWLASCWGLPA